MVDISLRKRGVPSDGPIWPYHFGHSAAAPAYGYNPGKAEALLDGLGLTRGHEHEPDRMPSRFRFTCLIAREDQRLHRIALMVQKQLFNIGVDMDVEVQSASEVQGRVVKPGQFEAASPNSRHCGPWLSCTSSGTRRHLRVPASAGLPLHAPPTRHSIGCEAPSGMRTFASPLRTCSGRSTTTRPPCSSTGCRPSRALSRDISVPNDNSRDIWGSIQQWKPLSTSSARR